MSSTNLVFFTVLVCLSGTAFGDGWQGSSALFLNDNNLQLHTASHGTSTGEFNGSFILLHQSDPETDTIAIHDDSFIWQMTMRCDGKMLAITDDTGIAYMTLKQERHQPSLTKLQISQSALVATMKGAGHYPLGTGCRGLAFSPSGKKLVVGDLSGTLWVANVTDDSVGSPLKISRLFEKGAITSLTFKDENIVLAASDFNNDMGHTGEPSVMQVNLSTGERASFTANVTAVSSLAYSFHSKILVVGGIDGSVYVYDDAGREKWHKEPPQMGRILPAFVAMPSDDSLIACGFSDCTIKVWDMDGKRESSSKSGHLGGVNCLRYSNDNSKIATTGANDTKITVSPALTLSNP